VDIPETKSLAQAIAHGQVIDGTGVKFVSAPQRHGATERAGGAVVPAAMADDIDQKASAADHASGLVPHRIAGWTVGNDLLDPEMTGIAPGGLAARQAGSSSGPHGEDSELAER
jgi:hypothetical protein